MGISPDEDLTSYVHVAHGLEVSSQTNTNFIVVRRHLPNQRREPKRDSWLCRSTKLHLLADMLNKYESDILNR
jgi:hypothetical protein